MSQEVTDLIPVLHTFDAIAEPGNVGGSASTRISRVSSLQKQCDADHIGRRPAESAASGDTDTARQEVKPEGGRPCLTGARPDWMDLALYDVEPQSLIMRRAALCVR